jgi:hypothetical protein
MLGGIGPCGRILCCTAFLPDYARVTIKMAKDQDLPLNPSKISGVCGRLLCCLSYEHEQYIEMRAQLPKRGTWVMTPDGPGEVIGQHVLKQQVLVQLASSGMIETYDIPQITIATEQVVALARARAAEGITPASTLKPERGEQRLLRDEIDTFDWNDDLSLLEDDDLPQLPPSPHVLPTPVLPPAVESKRVSEPKTTPKPRGRRQGDQQDKETATTVNKAAKPAPSQPPRATTPTPPAKTAPPDSSAKAGNDVRRRRRRRN